MDILVVDDEQAICLLFDKWLSFHGHRVKSALSSENALKFAEKQHFDVVFLDLIMLGTPAIDVLERVKEISPETEVIVISGYLLNKKIQKELEDKGVLQFFQKPFEMKEIVKIVKYIESKMSHPIRIKGSE